jgi:hypothetical protein
VVPGTLRPGRPVLPIGGARSPDSRRQNSRLAEPELPTRGAGTLDPRRQVPRLARPGTRRARGGSEGSDRELSPSVPTLPTPEAPPDAPSHPVSHRHCQRRTTGTHTAHRDRARAALAAPLPGRRGDLRGDPHPVRRLLHRPDPISIRSRSEPPACRSRAHRSSSGSGRSAHSRPSAGPGPSRKRSRSVAKRVQGGVSVGAARRHRVAATTPTGRAAWTHGHASPTSGDNSVDCRAGARGRTAREQWTTRRADGDGRRTTSRERRPSTTRGLRPESVPRLGPQDAAPSDLRRRRLSTLCTGPVPVPGVLSFTNSKRKRGVDGAHGRGGRGPPSTARRTGTGRRDTRPREALR